jgi:hypothetical protein
MSRHITFFATRQDSLDLLLYVEERAPLRYVRWGHYPSPEAPTYETASDIPDLGIARYGRKGESRYIVFPPTSALMFDKSEGAGVVYEPIPRTDSPYVFFHTGGLFRDECLITGYVATASESREGIRLFDRFYRALRTRFVRVGSGYRSLVGPEALGLLQAGMRFTDSVTSPRTLDFKLPRGWRAAEPGAAPDRRGR